MPENQITTNFIYLTISNFVTISQINYWDQLNSWKDFWKFWSGPLCRNKSGPSPLLNVVVYWQKSKTEACAKKLSQILANNIENGRRGLVSEFMWGIVGDKNIKGRYYWLTPPYTTQKSGESKRSDEFKKSIVRDSILLFTSKL